LTGLRDLVGPGHVLEAPDLVATYRSDWTGRFIGSTPAVVRPASTAQVAGVVALCVEHGVAIVPQGGNTGLVGGGVPLHGELVLSLRRMSAVGPVDHGSGQLTAEAGVTVADLQAAAKGAGWAYPIDLASRDSATVGGTIATNAGGLRVIRFGDTRRHLVGVEAVLGTGAVVSHLGGLRKDNTGYHLPGLFCGSEGTLGVVTAARFDLVPALDHQAVALVAFDDVRGAIDAAVALRRGMPALSAAEIFFDDGLELVCASSGLHRPFASPHVSYLLVEAMAAADPTGDLADMVASLSDVADVAVAPDSVRAAGLWRYREGHTEAINRVGVPHKLDVTLPAEGFVEFVAQVRELVGDVAPGSRTWLFGHAGDGNIHVNVTGLGNEDERVDDAVLRIAASFGGSISAEHGIGAAKRRWLTLNRSDDEIATFRAIKRALDPSSVMNPNVLLP
jgi:FAD/FMN-containing dehydrogenase